MSVHRQSVRGANLATKPGFKFTLHTRGWHVLYSDSIRSPPNRLQRWCAEHPVGPVIKCASGRPKRSYPCNDSPRRSFLLQKSSTLPRPAHVMIAVLEPQKSSSSQYKREESSPIFSANSVFSSRCMRDAARSRHQQYLAFISPTATIPFTATSDKHHPHLLCLV